MAMGAWVMESEKKKGNNSGVAGMEKELSCFCSSLVEDEDERKREETR